MRFENTGNPPQITGDGAAPIRALLLDDDEFDCKRIQRMSERLNLDISLTTTRSIGQMQQELDKNRFDLILLDYSLPDGNGLGALELVKDHADNNTAATVMITGDARTEIAVTAVKQGCMDFIAKDSMDLELMRKVVASALEHRATTTQARVALDLDAITRHIAATVRMEVSAALSRPDIIKGLQNISRDMTRDAMLTSDQEMRILMSDFLDETDFHFKS